MPAAFGSGFGYDGLGVKARGMGGAFRAVADDWSAAYYNPAGYNRIMDNIMTGNLDIFHNRFSTTPRVYRGDYPTGFYNDRELYNEHEFLNVPQGGIVFRLPVWGETVFGFSIMQTFDENHSWELYDNLLDYNRAAFSKKQFYNNLDVVAFQATAARGYMEDRLSIGIGLALLRGDLDYNSVVFRTNPYVDETDPVLRQIADRPYDKIPEWYATTGSGWGFGYTLGLLYEVSEKVDFGFVFKGPSTIDISGDAKFLYYLRDNPSLANSPLYFDTTEEHYFLEGVVEDVYADFETTLEVPPSVSGGIAYDVNEKLKLALDAEMVFWSNFEGFEFSFSDYTDLPRANFTRANDLMQKDVTVSADWDNAISYMMGGNYQLNNFTELRAGFGYDQSPIGETTYMPQFFDPGDQYFFSGGVGFDVDFWHLELALSYRHYENLNVWESSDVDGDGLMDNMTGGYTADKYHTILGISYRF